jgi:hypothetical protein
MRILIRHGAVQGRTGVAAIGLRFRIIGTHIQPVDPGASGRGKNESQTEGDENVWHAGTVITFARERNFGVREGYQGDLFLVPKFYLGTPRALRETLFRAN